MFVDFDDTIVDSTTVIVDIYNQRYGENADVKRIKMRDMTDECPRLGESHDGDYQAEIVELYASDAFWNAVQPKPGVIDVLNRFKEQGFEIVLVSYGNPENIAKKGVYAKAHFPMMDGYIYLTQHEMPFSKQDVNMQDCFFVDDHTGYLKDSNAAVKIMFGKETKGNRNPGYFNTSNWEEVYKYITTIYNANREIEPTPEEMEPERQQVEA